MASLNRNQAEGAMVCGASSRLTLRSGAQLLQNLRVRNGDTEQCFRRTCG